MISSVFCASVQLPWLGDAWRTRHYLWSFFSCFQLLCCCLRYLWLFQLASSETVLTVCPEFGVPHQVWICRDSSDKVYSHCNVFGIWCFFKIWIYSVFGIWSNFTISDSGQDKFYTDSGQDLTCKTKSCRTTSWPWNIADSTSSFYKMLKN